MKKLLSFTLMLIFLIVPISAYAVEATTPTGIPLSQIESRINELVETYMRDFTTGLAIAVVKDGEIVFSQGYGYADIERQIPINPATTVFELASTNKLFVFTSIMQLVEQGLLDLDNDIHVYLPEDSSQQFNFEKTFTMRDLLNHSAGFGEFDFNVRHIAEAVESDSRITLREALLASQPPQIFEPSTATSYSNFGIALAAYIVSHVSGLEYAEFERVNILNPLGMTNTRNQPHWFGDNLFLQNKARGHQPNGRGGFNEFPWYYLPMYPAGALNGTAIDIAQFAIALMPPQGEPSPLFSNRDTLDLMLSPSYSDPRILRGTHHGFRTYDAVVPALGHAGGTSGFNTDFVIVPSERFGIIVLTNTAGGITFIEKILDLFIGNSRNTAFPTTENLPNASSVTGAYMLLQRYEGNMMEMLNAVLLGTMQVNAIDENTITLNMGNGIVTYRQVEPYVFRAIDADTPAANVFARTRYKIYFTMENGQPVGVSLRGTNSATVHAPSMFESVISVGSLLVMLVGVIFFMIMPIIVGVKFFRKRGKDFAYFSLLINGVMTCGVLFAINLIMLMLRLGAGIPFIETATITPHIWINYILLVFFVVLFIVSLVFFKKQNIATNCKIFYFSTVAFLALFVLSLWGGNFFVI